MTNLMLKHRPLFDPNRYRFLCITTFLIASCAMSQSEPNLGAVYAIRQWSSFGKMMFSMLSNIFSYWNRAPALILLSLRKYLLTVRGLRHQGQRQWSWASSR